MAPIDAASPLPGLPTGETSPLRQALHARLRDGAAALGLTLDSQALARLDAYSTLLQQWGQKINLTAIPLDDPMRIAVQHFVDSLACVAQLPPVSALPSRELIDVGSGAGFPGVLCALMRPELRVTLVERVGKKAAFLLTLRRELGLSYLVESCDAERLIAADSGQGFGVAVSRAALPPPRWLDLGRRLVAPGGYVLAMMNDREAIPQAPDCSCLAESKYDIAGSPRRIITWQRRIAR